MAMDFSPSYGAVIVQTIALQTRKYADCILDAPRKSPRNSRHAWHAYAFLSFCLKACSGVLEVMPDKKIVFEFTTTGQVWSCQRMSDGNTLVGAASQGKLLVIGPDKKINKTISLRNAPGHSCLRNARQIANGHFLVAEESAHAAREYDADGGLVREIKLAFAPYSAVRLDNGNTDISGEQTIVEVDAGDKIIWSISGKDLPQAGIRWFAGIQVLPNGNLFVCNAGGKVPLLEYSWDKAIVWQSPSEWSIPLGHGIQLLDIEGAALK